MGKRRSQPFRQFVIWTCILGGHILLLMLFMQPVSQRIRSTASGLEERSELVLIEIPPITEELPQAQQAPRPAITVQPRQAPRSDTAITLPAEESAPKRPAVDWYGQAEEAARAAVEGTAKTRAFGEMPESPYTKCKKTTPNSEWEPEPKRAGLAGGLPYVRLGKRCAVGLGFFGCAMGKLPEAKGDLFKDMRNPDRPTSSVPDVDECNP